MPRKARHKREGRFASLIRFAKFAIVGGVTMLLGLMVMALCVEIIGLKHWPAYVIQMVFSVLFNFTLNQWWTFRDKGLPYWTGLRKFIGVRGLITMPLNLILFDKFDKIGLDYWTGWFVCAVLAMGINWFLAKHFVWAQKYDPSKDLKTHGYNVAAKRNDGDSSQLAITAGEEGAPSATLTSDREHTAATASASTAVSDSKEEALTTSDIDGDPGYAEDDVEQVSLGWHRIPAWARNNELARRNPVMSFVIPVKGADEHIVDVVRAILNQEGFQDRIDLVVVGDKEDTAWVHLQRLFGQITCIGVDVKSPGRDSNVKRNLGLKNTCDFTHVMALVDGDVILPPDWAQKAFDLITLDGHDAVSGPVFGIGDTYWTDYIDKNAIAAKMPRYADNGQVLNSENISKKGVKFPVTANVAFTRDIYKLVGFLPEYFVNSYEDYSWFSLMVRAGGQILCTPQLTCTRRHREGFKRLSGEYFRSGKGCADLVHAFRDECGFAKKRLRQYRRLRLTVVLAIIAAIVFPLQFGAVTLSGFLLASAYSAAKARKWIAFSYPLVTFYFAMRFALGLATRLTAHPGFVRPAINGKVVYKSAFYLYAKVVSGGLVLPATPPRAALEAGTTLADTITMVAPNPATHTSTVPSPVDAH